MMAATCHAFKADIIAQPSLKKARHAGFVLFPPPTLDHRRPIHQVDPVQGVTCRGTFIQS